MDAEVAQIEDIIESENHSIPAVSTYFISLI